NKKLFTNDDLIVAASESQEKKYTPLLIYQTQKNLNKYVIQKYLQYKPVIVPLFNFNPGFVKSHTTTNDSFSNKIKDGFFKITLQQDFLHKHYARLFAIAMSKVDKKTVIP